MNAKPFIFAGVRLTGVLGLWVCTAGAADAAHTNAPTKRANFASFQIVPDRNIFNPNRIAHTVTRPYTPRSTRRATSFTLAGIMSYGQGATPGTYAFFDGTSADLRKVLQPAGVIADFKVAAITYDTVTLLRETNQTVLKVGMQMRQASGGTWLLATQSMSNLPNAYDEGVVESPDRTRTNMASPSSAGALSVATPEGSDTNAVDGATGPDNADPPGGPPPEPEASPAETLALPPGPGNDALRRLMLLRQQEEQQSGNR